MSCWFSCHGRFCVNFGWNWSLVQLTWTFSHNRCYMLLLLLLLLPLPLHLLLCLSRSVTQSYVIDRNVSSADTSHSLAIRPVIQPLWSHSKRLVGRRPSFLRLQQSFYCPFPLPPAVTDSSLLFYTERHIHRCETTYVTDDRLLLVSSDDTSFPSS